MKNRLKEIAGSFRDKISRAREAYKVGMRVFHSEHVNAATIRGEVMLDMRDARTGEILLQWHKKNIITRDAGILLARLCRDPLEPSNGIHMLAVGTGASGNVLSPDAPDDRQRRLNAEIARKPFSSTTFRDSSGNAVSYPTNILDLTTTFGEAEAVGPLNEMGLLSTISDNTTVTNSNPASFPTYDATVDVTQYDMLFNYLTFGVVSKPSNAVLTFTWRLTY